MFLIIIIKYSIHLKVNKLYIKVVFLQHQSTILYLSHFPQKIKNPIDSIFSEKMILQIIEFSYMNF